MEPEEEEEMEPPADEEVGASGKVKEADQSVEYITYLMNAVELYQKKNKNCFGCGSPDYFV